MMTLSDFNSIYNKNKQNITKVEFKNLNKFQHLAFMKANNNKFHLTLNMHSSSEMIVDCLGSFNKVTKYDLNVDQLNNSALFAISENKNTEILSIYCCSF